METLYYKEALPDGSFNCFAFSGMTPDVVAANLAMMTQAPITQITKDAYDAAMASLQAARG